MAPFLFYCNPGSINGIRELCTTGKRRQDLFIASGGSDRSEAAMEQRLDDALTVCGGNYLDMFVIEYVEPHEINNANKNNNMQMTRVMKKTKSWVDQGRVRYVAASTHSHVVAKQLLLLKTTTTSTSTMNKNHHDDDDADDSPTTTAATFELDAIMLRYNMAHKKAAQRISFPAAVKAKKPVLVFTTTRWNALQKGHTDWNSSSTGSCSSNGNDDEDLDLPPPSTGDCLSFALAAGFSPPVEIVLHSARDERELLEALGGFRQNMSAKDVQKWSRYGDLDWNDDGFDEYPEEEQEQLIV